MVDQFVSFSNQNSLDIFPSFKSFHKPKDDQGAFTIDSKDLKEMKKPMPTNSVPKTNNSKGNTTTSDTTKKTNANPLAQCDICLVPISSQIVYDIHVKGRKHQTQLATVLSKNVQYKTPTYEELFSKKPEPIMVTNSNEKSESSSSELPASENKTVSPLIPSKKLICTLCNVTCNSEAMFDNHITGKKHQTKLKLASFTNPAPPRAAPDKNPSLSNDGDVRSSKLNSKDQLTKHPAQNQYQTQVKEAEICVKETADINVNSDDYKISIADTTKDSFNYQCTTCNIKYTNKMHLSDHLKSALHTRLSNLSNNQRSVKNSNRGNHQTTRRGVTRGGPAARSESFSPSRGAMKSPGKSRPYRPQRSSWNQPSQSFNQQTSANPFGAFDPDNQYYHSSAKRPTQYEETLNEYDEFSAKRSRPYNDEGNHSQDFYSNDGNYYSSSTLSNYPSNSNPYSTNQSTVEQSAWQYQTDPYYDQQQYSTSGSVYVNPIYYESSQPPLPNYEPPPLPAYPPPSSHPSYSPSSAFFGSTENQGNNNFFPSSFHH